MCGRYDLDVSAEELIRHFNLSIKRAQGYQRRYNVAPQQQVPVITNDAPKQLALIEWGLLPPWAKPGKKVHRSINARAETVAEKPTFRRALKERRCLVPASGFFEWQATKDGKVPYRIHRKDGEPFAFAG